MPHAVIRDREHSQDSRHNFPPKQTERRRQIRGLLLLALAAILFAILRAGPHRVFTPGWWRLW
jgi:hypothetical protein